MDFGIGTFNGVDGEMVCLDCWFFQITADRIAGDHVLDARMQNVSATLDATPEFHLDLPDTDDFRKANLEADQSADLSRVEQ